MKCVDPCPGVCGINAECYVANHAPSCNCLPGYTGNPSEGCRKPPIRMCFHCFPKIYLKSQSFTSKLNIFTEYLPPENPCHPSPCGPYSICREVNGHAVCTCQQAYIGQPPNCRPECIINSECLPDKACVNQRCIDPCPDTCGLNANCKVINHSPVCSCPPNYEGDPFNKCLLKARKYLKREQ